MARTILDISKIFESDDSQGNALASFLQKRRGMLPKANLVFGTSRENRPSFDVHIEGMHREDPLKPDNSKLPIETNGISQNSSKELTISVSSKNPKGSIQKNEILLCSSRTVENIPKKTNTKIISTSGLSDESVHNKAQPVNNNNNCNDSQVLMNNATNEKIASLRSGTSKVSHRDHLRRFSIQRSTRLYPSRQILLDEIHNLEISEGASIAFNPVICSTPNSKSNTTFDNPVHSIDVATDATSITGKCATVVDEINQFEEELQNAFEKNQSINVNQSKRNPVVRLNFEDILGATQSRNSSCGSKGESPVTKNNVNDKADNDSRTLIAVNSVNNVQNENLPQITSEGMFEQEEDNATICKISTNDSANNTILNNVQINNGVEKEQRTINNISKSLGYIQEPLNLVSHATNDIIIIEKCQKPQDSKKSPLSKKIHKESQEKMHEPLLPNKKKTVKLNKAPGIPMNGEAYAKELNKLSNNEILDLRKRNSLGKVFKAENTLKPATGVQVLKEIKEKQQELENLIRVELSKRNLLVEETVKETPKETKIILETEHQKESLPPKNSIDVETCDQMTFQRGENIELNTSISTNTAPINSSNDKSREVQRKDDVRHDQSIINCETTEKENQDLMSDILRHYIEVPTKIAKRKQSLRRSKRLLYSENNISEINEEITHLEETPQSKSDRNQEKQLNKEIDEEIVDFQEMSLPPVCKNSYTNADVMEVPLPSQSTSKKRNSSENESTNTTFKKPKTVVPKKRASRNQKIQTTETTTAESTYSTGLRRSNRVITPNKSFQFVQELYQAVIEKRKLKALANSSSSSRCSTTGNKRESRYRSSRYKPSTLKSIREDTENTESSGDEQYNKGSRTKKRTADESTVKETPRKKKERKNVPEYLEENSQVPLPQISNDDTSTRRNHYTKTKKDSHASYNENTSVVNSQINERMSPPLGSQQINSELENQIPKKRTMKRNVEQSTGKSEEAAKKIKVPQKKTTLHQK